MSENNLDNYMNKLAQIKAVSENYDTTKTEYETLVDELTDLGDTIDNNIIMPLTISHLNKLIIVQIARSMKVEFLSFLLNLVALKVSRIQTLSTPDANVATLDAFKTETASLKAYADILIGSCSCMKSMENVIKKISKQ